MSSSQLGSERKLPSQQCNRAKSGQLTMIGLHNHHHMSYSPAQAQQQLLQEEKASKKANRRAEHQHQSGSSTTTTTSGGGRRQLQLHDGSQSMLIMMCRDHPQPGPDGRGLGGSCSAPSYELATEALPSKHRHRAQPDTLGAEPAARFVQIPAKTAQQIVSQVPKCRNPKARLHPLEGGSGAADDQNPFLQQYSYNYSQQAPSHPATAKSSDQVLLIMNDDPIRGGGVPILGRRLASKSSEQLEEPSSRGREQTSASKQVFRQHLHQERSAMIEPHDPVSMMPPVIGRRSHRAIEQHQKQAALCRLVEANELSSGQQNYLHHQTRLRAEAIHEPAKPSAGGDTVWCSSSAGSSSSSSSSSKQKKKQIASDAKLITRLKAEEMKLMMQHQQLLSSMKHHQYHGAESGLQHKTSSASGAGGGDLRCRMPANSLVLRYVQPGQVHSAAYPGLLVPKQTVGGSTKSSSAASSSSSSAASSSHHQPLVRGSSSSCSSLCHRPSARGASSVQMQCCLDATCCGAELPVGQRSARRLDATQSGQPCQLACCQATNMDRQPRYPLNKSLLKHPSDDQFVVYNRHIDHLGASSKCQANTGRSPASDRRSGSCQDTRDGCRWASGVAREWPMQQAPKLGPPVPLKPMVVYRFGEPDGIQPAEGARPCHRRSSRPGEALQSSGRRHLAPLDHNYHDQETAATTQMYESLASELKAKLSDPKAAPILLPPKDYDTISRRQGKLTDIELRRSTNPQLVGPAAAAAALSRLNSVNNGTSARSNSHNEDENNDVPCNQFHTKRHQSNHQLTSGCSQSSVSMSSSPISSSSLNDHVSPNRSSRHGSRSTNDSGQQTGDDESSAIHQTSMNLQLSRSNSSSGLGSISLAGVAGLTSPSPSPTSSSSLASNQAHKVSLPKCSDIHSRAVRREKVIELSKPSGDSHLQVVRSSSVARRSTAGSSEELDHQRQVDTFCCSSDSGHSGESYNGEQELVTLPPTDRARGGECFGRAACDNELATGPVRCSKGDSQQQQRAKLARGKGIENHNPSKVSDGSLWNGRVEVPLKINSARDGNTYLATKQIIY